ncbi:MAG TPA: DUF87 domain-containing protein [Candidatus Bathyarchaeia archaeon]|nr:MAG: hypothetical protein A3K70_04300 [Candidatus Bathyarchaeota archaeon RBG_16_48_13]HJX24198.1 DUF87 domain-containing protein [Candidatus Bathyarchaeia archaeon]
MMRLYKIENGTLQILSCPPEGLRRGDYLLVEDGGKALIAHIIDVAFANVPGIMEDLLRDLSGLDIDAEDVDPLNLKSYLNQVRDAQLYICKVRGTLSQEGLSSDVSWIPSRCTAKIAKISDEKILKMVSPDDSMAIGLGFTRSGAEIAISAHSIDGKLNIITGKKESGKSNFSKLLMLGLIDHGGKCIVFDVNGEYTKLGFNKDGTQNKYYEKVVVLTPGRNFQTAISYVGIRVVLNILRTVFDLPETSAWEFRRIWESLDKKSVPTLQSLKQAIESTQNEFIKDALIRRFDGLINSSLFTDDPKLTTTLEDQFKSIPKGGTLVINLRELPQVYKRLVVEFVLSKLTGLLERWTLRGVFLFAEEAHLYLNDTYWEDIVTRMRHLGIFTTFITNQPDSIKQAIYRQADNAFLFNFTNENDLETVSKSSKIDVETVKILARELPPHHCLILGKATSDYPMVVKIKALNVSTLGETRFFFGNN